MMNEPPLMNFPSGNFDEKKKENKKILLLMNILKKQSPSFHRSSGKTKQSERSDGLVNLQHWKEIKSF